MTILILLLHLGFVPRSTTSGTGAFKGTYPIYTKGSFVYVVENENGDYEIVCCPQCTTRNSTAISVGFETLADMMEEQHQPKDWI